MSQTTTNDALRAILEGETEAGDINIGVGVDQFLRALQFGRVPIDLFAVPEDKRLEVYREIVALVERRSAQLRNGNGHAPESISAAG